MTSWVGSRRRERLSKSQRRSVSPTGLWRTPWPGRGNIFRVASRLTSLDRKATAPMAATRAPRAFDPNGAIQPQKNEFDDKFLDIVGTEFKFDHAKGFAEWMKNSADAYSTIAHVKDAEQFILLRFKPGRPKKDSVFECVDFVGMTKENIDKALKIWGLPS